MIGSWDSRSPVFFSDIFHGENSHNLAYGGDYEWTMTRLRRHDYEVMRVGVVLCLKKSTKMGDLEVASDAGQAAASLFMRLLAMRSSKSQRARERCRPALFKFIVWFNYDESICNCFFSRGLILNSVSVCLIRSNLNAKKMVEKACVNGLQLNSSVTYNLEGGVQVDHVCVCIVTCSINS